MGISNRTELQQHLLWAMSVELALIQPYLYAMYSICDPTSEAYRLVRSVVTEEMLHAVLDANLLVAIGGEPRFYSEANFPSYPMAMPHHKPELILNLEPMSPALLDMFIVIEQPKDHVGGVEDMDSDEYQTQGQFYLAIEHAIERLNRTSDLFANPRPERQMGDSSYYSPVEFDAEDSGGIVLIDSIEAAEAAIDIVIHQGEGLHEEHYADPAELELTHYFKFKNIAEGNPPLGEVWPMATNPKRVDFGADAGTLCDLFNAAYCYTLVTLDEIYEPLDDALRSRLVGRLYRLMSDVMGPVARALTQRPLRPGAELHAGPSFEFHRFASPETAREELVALAKTAAPIADDLDDVIGVVEGL